ncbi:hypothetical protein [Undibacterium sp. SXout20W]|uniref:hypothetical protein n=1 Tax=Undibacterium sp. SXout20W TaxID=3413051 RepID=UPI003BF3E666
MKAITARSSISLTVALASFFCVINSASAFSEPAFQSSFKKFTSASGNTDTEQAAQEFQQLLNAEPANPLLMAYAGAATAKLATTTIFPWKKMSYAEDGMAKLDKALQITTNVDNLSNSNSGIAMHGNVPVTLEVKFVAANTFLAVPGFMNRAAQGQKLLNEILQHPQFINTVSSFRGAVWLRAANLALEQKHPELAKTYLNAVIQANAPQANSAASLLKGIPS